MSSSSASSGRKRFNVRKPAVVVDIGCNCRKLKLITSLFSSCSPSKSKLKSNSSAAAYSSSSAKTATSTTYTSSSCDLASSFISSATSNYEEASGNEVAPLQRKEQTAAQRRRKKKRPSSSEAAASTGRVARESVAVVKETSEPYAEFKESMVQMIVEKEIYGWDDLNDLLHSFLSLNSPRHHHVIIRAFADLWSGVFSPSSPLADAGPAAGDYCATSTTYDPPANYYHY